MCSVSGSEAVEQVAWGEAAISESSRGRSRTPPRTPRTPVRTHIAALEAQLAELKAELESHKRTMDILSSVVIQSNNKVKRMMQQLRLHDVISGEDVSESLLASAYFGFLEIPRLVGI